jgi:glycerophosphoryl diester phosphodiesterase
VVASVASIAAATHRRAAVSAQPQQSIPLLSSFSPIALSAARDAQPALPRGLLVHRVPPDWRERLEALACDALHVDHKYLNEAQARSIKAAGYWLFCYTVNTPERARQIRSWGVDAFCTDRIDRIAPNPAADT